MAAGTDSSFRINVRCIGERKKSPCRPAARRANAEQKNFVAFHDEPIGCRSILLQSAAGELKGAVALPAVEMVVMSLTGSFIQSPEQWMDDPFQPPVINEKLEVPVDRCLVERVHALAAVCLLPPINSGPTFAILWTHAKVADFKDEAVRAAV